VGRALSALIHTGPGASEPPQQWVNALLPKAKRLGLGVDHQPQFSVQAQERVDLYTVSEKDCTLFFSRCPVCGEWCTLHRLLGEEFHTNGSGCRYGSGDGASGD
jgi:hypothetical protein